MMTKFHSPTPPPPESQIETDSRFPSGPWCGFFLMSHLPGRHQMELHLTFRQGVMTGEGRDRIGAFLIRGRYQVEDGQSWWTKRYIGKHDVSYRGYNEGKGIWGLWEIPPSWKGDSTFGPRQWAIPPNRSWPRRSTSRLRWKRKPEPAWPLRPASRWVSMPPLVQLPGDKASNRQVIKKGLPRVDHGRRRLACF